MYQFKPVQQFIENTNHDARKAWHDALLTTKSEQACGELHDNENGFCCLGIYAHEVENIEKSSLVGQGTLQQFIDQIEISHNPEIGGTETGAIWNASELNDTFELTFDQIAKLVYPEAYGGIENVTVAIG